MKKSEEKQKLVEELASLHERLDKNRLYAFPNQKDTQKWIEDVRSVLKNLDEGDYQEFVRLSKTVGLSGDREKRKKAAKEINQFLGGKVAEWKRYDFSYLDKEKTLQGANYWNFVNPFWFIWKLLVFVWHHKLISAAAIIISLLGIDYSLAWKNTLWIVGMFSSLFGRLFIE